MKVKITYLDTAMALIEIGSLRILTDPVLDEAGTTYDDGVISLEKTSAAAISLQELGRIDATFADQVRADLAAAEKEKSSFMLTPLVLEVVAEKV